MVPDLYRAAWKVKAPSDSLPWSLTRSHCTTNISPGRGDDDNTIQGSKVVNSFPTKHQSKFLNVGRWVTVVQVLHSGFFGGAGVEISHERGDVLRGGEHAMRDVPHENKA